MAIEQNNNVGGLRRAVDPNQDADSKSWLRRFADSTSQPGGIAGMGMGATPEDFQQAVDTGKKVAAAQSKALGTAPAADVANSPNNFDPAADNISQGNLAAANSMLPAGLKRYGGVQGVYAGRAKDGSLYFTDSPNDAFTAATVDPRGLRRSDVNVAEFANATGGGDGTAQVNASNPRGVENLPGAQGDYPTVSGRNGRRSDDLYAMMNGQTPDTGGVLHDAPNASRAYAGSSIGDVSPQMLDAMNYGQLQDTQARLAQATAASVGDPEQVAANQIALGRVNAKLQGLRRGDYPGAYGPGGTMAGGMGAPGMPGGLTAGNLIAWQGQQERAARDNAEIGLRRQAESREANTAQQAVSDKLLKNYNDALTAGDHTAADQIAIGALPQFDNTADGRSRAAKWAASKEGQGALSLALRSLRRSAYDTQWFGEPINKSALSSGRVGWKNAILDDNGRFTGFSGAPGSDWNIAPTDPWLQGGKYNADLLDRLQPYLPYLTQQG